MAYRDSTVNLGNSATPSVAVPAGVQAGDIVILALTQDTTAATVDVADWPTGFTEMKDVDQTADGQTCALAWKRLTGADSGTYTMGNIGASAGWTLAAFAFSGRHATDPPVASADNIVGTAATGASPATVTANGVVAVAGDDLLWISMPDVTVQNSGNGAAPPASYTEAEDSLDGGDGWAPLAGAYRENVGAGATGAVSGTFTFTAGDFGYAAWLIRVPAAAGGGTAHTASPSDALGITDSVDVSVGRGVAITDALGVTDARVFDRGLVQADALGLTDSAAPIILKAVQVDDVLALTDAVTLAQGLALADGLGVTDTLTSTAVLQRTIVDSLGITDSTTALILILKQLDDALGVTDALASQVAFVRTLNEPLGITDTLTPVGVFQRAVADALGVTDSAASQVGRGATIADALGITDTQAFLATYVRTIDDLIVITDSATPLFMPFRVTPALPAFGVVIETAPRFGGPIETLRTGRYEL